MDVIIIIALILLNGLFSMSEVAMITARKSSLSIDAKKGNKSARMVLNMTEEPSKFLSTVQIGITLIGILTGLFSGNAFAEQFSKVFVNLGMSDAPSLALSQTLIVVIVTFLSILFGELMPKQIGLSAAEKIAKTMVGPMVALSWISSPIVWILSKTSNGLLKLFGVKQQETKVTEEEIKSMIAEGKEGGEVKGVEQDIVERVFSLGDRDVESIMTSRNEIVWIDIDMTNKEINELVQENLYEVYPVADGSLDKIVGVVFLKELFGKLVNPDFSIKSIINPVQYVPENMDVYKMLEQMQEQQIGYSLVSDEFGLCQGIVTHKDILEGLVGAISDKEDDPDIVEREGDGWLVDGQCSFYQFLEHFEMEEIYPQYEFNTVGGLTLDVLERIPVAGEQFTWKKFEFEIVDMDGARIDKLIVKIKGDDD